jgi:hypothetical protein
MTRTASIALSPKGLKSANHVGRKDFRFISGADIFLCDRFQATFVSPRITELLELDSTVSEFILEHANSQSFEILENLICGETIRPSDNSMKAFLDLIEDLGNAELSESVINFIESDIDLNVSNCISRLKRKKRLNVDSDCEIQFIGTHISDIEIENMRDLEIGVIENILHGHSLRIPNEDWLLKFIVDLGPIYYGLIGSVRFEFLSPKSIDLFFTTFSIDQLDAQIWERMRNRMRHQLLYEREELSNAVFLEAVNRVPNSPWSGLISHLRDLCHGNVHENGVVEITCSSPGRHKCWEVVNDWLHHLDFPFACIPFVLVISSGIVDGKSKCPPVALP